jgi:hypothetical protein
MGLLVRWVEITAWVEVTALDRGVTYVLIGLSGIDVDEVTPARRVAMHQTARTGADSLGDEGHRNDIEPPAQWIIRPPASGLRVKAGSDSDQNERQRERR